jgi:hypothetical protein
MSLSSGFGQLRLKFSDVQNLLQQVYWASPSVSYLRGTYKRVWQLYLDGGRSPGYEVGQLTLSDTLEALVHLGRVHLTLHNNQEHEMKIWKHENSSGRLEPGPQ